MNGATNEREQMRQEIASYSRQLMLSGGVLELCASEADRKSTRLNSSHYS